jgi:hypothetical protein
MRVILTTASIVISLIMMVSCGTSTRLPAVAQEVTKHDILALKAWPMEGTLSSDDWMLYRSTAARFQRMSEQGRRSLLLQVTAESGPSSEAETGDPDGIVRRIVILLRMIYRAEMVSVETQPDMVSQLTVFRRGPFCAPIHDYGWPLYWQVDAKDPQLLQIYMGREHFDVLRDYEFLSKRVEQRRL